MNLKQLFKENRLLLVLYSVIFFYLIYQEAIYSPDTYGYAKAIPYRHLGYVIFVKTFLFVFADYFDIAVKIFQSIFCLVSIHFFFKTFVALLKPNLLIKCIVLGLLFFPLFEPLNVVNNVCPEGISYSLYLIFVTLNLEFLFNNNSRVLKYIVLCFLALVFTRGQFIFTGLIFSAVYIAKHRNHLFKINIVSKLLILVLMPILVVLGEMTYHKLKDGIFMTTPFGFVNMSSAAYYVSNIEDAQYIPNEDYRAIFVESYNELKRKKLLLSSQPNSSYKDYYTFFHDHIPEICNHTTFITAQNYFLEKDPIDINKPNPAIARSFYNAEKANKGITLALIKHNFKSWFQLYLANITHSFYSIFLLVIIIIAFIFSLIKMCSKFHKWYALLFICTALSLSNAVLIAIASHSIMRYTFYNYTFIFLTLLLLFKIIRHGIKD
ncbi:hypothetical protein [Psychroserpens ponticola]|uniref:Glycosyltransferase RgtA/B/C/D-like domain-containing protein n=1 Tax=Psychroserpens ponticola TaxID=2932268 RepID=A0ABY7RUQ4_9FLAO|nr:hypothetical protein [Psychroserpens ponticola]WCO00837.1 hypothetical protein MUN68_012260 [Psychroserpens ponticola]